MILKCVYFNLSLYYYTTFSPQYVLCIFSNQLMHIYNVIINGYIIFHCGGVHDSQLSIGWKCGLFSGFLFLSFCCFCYQQSDVCLCMSLDFCASEFVGYIFQSRISGSKVKHIKKIG